MKDKTITASITQDQVEQVEQNYQRLSEALEELERLIGTYETYGTFNIARPNYSGKADLTRLNREVA